MFHLKPPPSFIQSIVIFQVSVPPRIPFSESVNTAVVLIKQASRFRTSFESKKTAIVVWLSCQLSRTDQLPCLVSRPMALIKLNAHGFPDYLLALFHQSKRFYAEKNVKSKATRNEIR